MILGTMMDGTNDARRWLPAASRWRGAWPGVVALLVALSAALLGVHIPAAEAAAGGGWPTYLGSNSRAGFNAAEMAITPVTAPNLRLHWTRHASSSTFSQPVVANGLVHWGSTAGYEHATTLAGAPAWSTFIGQTTESGCGITETMGVVNAPAVVTLGGTPRLFVGGGDAQLYALNAATGQILWRTRLGPSPTSFIWSSPAVFTPGGSATPSVYVGLADLYDCPDVQGKLFQVNAATGAIQHAFKVVPGDCTGGSIWGSPAIDAAAGKVYVATGNLGPCGRSEPYAEAIVELNAADLSYVASWQVRAADGSDLDFGSTPTLFSATIHGVTHAMLGVANKDGVYYALDRYAVGRGPLWRARIAIAGDCAYCGGGSISPSAWDGATLYVAGGNTTVGGVGCAGSLRALDPATGAFRWERCFHGGPVLGAVSSVRGVVFVGEGAYFVAASAADGHTLSFFQASATNSRFWSAASVAGGVVYIGNRDGTLFAFGL